MKKNDQFQIEITGMTDNGEGVGRAEGMAVFVPYTIVGERVRVHIVKVMKSHAIGKLVEVLSPSIHRLKAACPYFYQCGGCQLWHMDYQEELRYKQQKVTDCLQRIGGIAFLPSPIVGAESRCHYRNKAQFPVTPEGIGMYAERSHRLIALEHCLIQSESTADIIKTIQYWMTAYEIIPYDEKTGKGLIRHIYIRETDEGIMVCLVSAKRHVPHLENLVTLLREAKEDICSVILNVHTQKNNVILGRENIVLWGKEKLHDHLQEISFCISPLSFYQVNKAQMIKLYDKVRTYAGLTGKETVWDLYCGIGTIGQYLARDCKQVIGIEIVEDAVKNAIENAALNQLENTEYYCGAAEQIAPKLIKETKAPDIVILDPPRKGCDTVLLDTIVEVSPSKVLYVSCKPSTLARDLKYLCAHGYTVEEVSPVDMFPATAHVETVCLLSKGKIDEKKVLEKYETPGRRDGGDFA